MSIPQSTRDPLARILELEKKEEENQRNELFGAIKESAKQEDAINNAVRAGYSVKIMPQDKRSYLEGIYGKNNVFDTDSGPIVRDGNAFRFIDKPAGLDKATLDEGLAYLANMYLTPIAGPVWTPAILQKLIPKAASEALGDVVDWTGEAIEAIPNIAIQVLTKGKASGAGKRTILGAIADATGSALRQGASALLPGTESMSLTQRGQMMGTNVLAGGATELGSATLGKIAKLSPQALKQKAVTEKILGGPQAKQLPKLKSNIQRGLELEKEFGTRLSAGQLAGTEAGYGLTQTLKNAGELGETLDAQTVALAKRADALFDKIGKGKVDSTIIGDEAGEAWNNAVKRIIEKRSKKGKELFDIANNSVGGKRVISLDNTISKMEELAKDNYVPGGSADQRAVVTGLMSRIKELKEVGEKVSPREINSLLSSWGKASRGVETAIENIGRGAKDRHIAGEVFGALKKDLDLADAGEALKTAREQWAKDSKLIEELDSGLLSRVFKSGETSDMLAKQISKPGYSNKKLSIAMRILDKANPKIAARFRSGVVQEMLKDSKGAVTLEHTAKVLQGTPAQSKLAALYSGANTPSARKEFMEVGKTFKDLQEWSSRVTRKGPLGRGSQTAPEQLIERLLGLNLPTGVLGAARDVIAPWSNTRKLATALHSDEGRRLILKIGKELPKPETKELIRLQTQLLSVMARDKYLFPDEEEKQ